MEDQKGSPSNNVIITFLGLILLVGCQKNTNYEELSRKNLVRVGNPDIEHRIGDGTSNYLVLGDRALTKKLQSGRMRAPSSALGHSFLNKLSFPLETTLLSPNPGSLPLAPVRNSSLHFGFPVSNLSLPHFFGGVITSVSARTNETLGRLKLANFPSIHVSLLVVKLAENQFALGLKGCLANCTDNSEELPLMAIPITAVDEQQNLLMIDLASLGEELNLVKIIDPAGTVTKLKTKSSMTVTFDYSNSTLVFDVESHMIPVDASPFDSSVPETIITARWYLNHSLSADPLFEPREATEGVGFFMTQRAQRPKINRRPVPSRPIKYFIKNVPAEFQAGFAMAFDEWNTHLENILGRKLLSYEFIDVTDPRSTLLVTGDIRYNIIEWDLVNVAQYGGLGPSIANQLTGEILSGNVLVQGPKIVTAYKKWFDVSEAARSLRSSGSHMEADRILLMTSRQIQEEFKKLEVATYDLSIGKLSFQIPSQLPPLQDPITQREDFEELPTGFSFQAYMKDYFSDLLAHELGHNLGLRHNFRGSLSGSELPAPGEVSHSVMEYLGRTHRHLNRVGVYDIMAIKYGYMNIKPDRTDFFCTDENVPDLNQKGSAECSRDDASKDPFNFFENRLAKASYLLVGRGSSSPPEWTVPDMQRELDAVLKGMALYASTAESTSKHWTNFFSNPDRPSTPNEIIGYVLGKIRRYLCNPEFETIIESKESEEGKKKTRGNIELLRARAATLILPLKVFSETDLSCR